MRKLTICSNDVSGVTVVPNLFIDKYMLSANGAYVKVYLYLIRCISNQNPDLSVSFLADTLDVVENDILRALTYWEKLGLLTLIKTPDNEISSIQLHSFSGSTGAASVDTYTKATLETAVTVAPSEEATPVVEAKQASSQSRPNYSKEKITQLTNNDEVKWMMNIIELYLNRPLRPLDIQLILYLYEEIKFSAELIMYLYEYCVSKNKTSPAYIESVALAWAKEGIDTEEKAKEATTTYQVSTSAVAKAFGLNRTPGQIEQEYILKWYQVYKFNDDIITEACNRTILRTGKPDFKYADKILETWFKKNAKNLEDIASLDLAFSKGGSSNPTSQRPVPPKQTNNKFNAFPQRTYTNAEYASIEQRLLNKSYLNK